MPIRVKTENAVSRTWTRRESRDSLSSADHLIAVYSLESKDPSFDAVAAAAEINNQKQSGGPRTNLGRGRLEPQSASWVKSPWAVCFPPQLHTSAQQISERLEVDLPAIATPPSAMATTMKSPLSNAKQCRQKLKSKQTQEPPPPSVSCGYEFEHKEDREGNPYVLHIEQSEIASSALAFSDDDSVSSWGSQNAVKFNKKLKPKTADAHCVKETSTSIARLSVGTGTEVTAPATLWEKWDTKPTDLVMSTEHSESRRVLKESTRSKESAFASLSLEKRDEVEALSDTRSIQSRRTPERADEGGCETQIKESRNEISKATKSAGVGESRVANSDLVPMKHRRNVKKSVRFTNPLVTSQHFRPKTRPEEVSLLYFDEDELEILEEDRETTSRDQFEMIAQELSENRLRISIAYQNRWRDPRRRASSSGSGGSGGGGSVQVALSASDV